LGLFSLTVLLHDLRHTKKMAIEEQIEEHTIEEHVSPLENKGETENELGQYRPFLRLVHDWTYRQATGCALLQCHQYAGQIPHSSISAAVHAAKRAVLRSLFLAGRESLRRSRPLHGERKLSHFAIQKPSQDMDLTSSSHHH